MPNGELIPAPSNEVSVPRNPALTIIADGEADLSFDRQEHLLQTHLESCLAGGVNVAGAALLIDTLSTLAKASSKIEPLYHSEHVRELIDETCEILRDVVKQRRKRLAIKPLRDQLMTELIPAAGPSQALQNLMLLRRLLAFAGKEPSVAVALSLSVKKIMPHVIAAETKLGRLYDAKRFIDSGIKPVIRIANEYVSEKLGSDLAADVVQDVTNKLAAQFRQQ